MTPEGILKDIEAELEALRSFMDIGEGAVTVGETEDIDWINNWKQYFHQFTIDDVLVIPSWEEIGPMDKDKLVLNGSILIRVQLSGRVCMIPPSFASGH